MTGLKLYLDIVIGDYLYALRSNKSHRMSLAQYQKAVGRYYPVRNELLRYAGRPGNIGSRNGLEHDHLFYVERSER